MIKVFMLVVTLTSGNAYVVDHNLTAEDCAFSRHLLQRHDQAQATYSCEASED